MSFSTYIIQTQKSYEKNNTKLKEINFKKGENNMFEKLVGKRFESLEDLQNTMSEISGRKVKCIESESEMLEDTDYMIDYEVKGNPYVHTLFYLKGRGRCKYYITEV